MSYFSAKKYLDLIYIMSSYAYSSYRPRRKNVLAGARRFATRAGMLPAAGAARNVATQRRAGRPPKSLFIGPKMSDGSVSRTAQGVSTQTGASMTMTRRRKPKSGKTYQAKPRLQQNRVVSTILRSNIKTIPMIFQSMNELDTGYGANFLTNVVDVAGSTTGRMPLQAFCLTTLDAGAAQGGDRIPQFLLARDTTFSKTTIPVVFGNTAARTPGFNDNVNKLFLSSIKIRMLFWGRINKETTYQVQVLRFRKTAWHINPFVTPEEQLSLSGLSSDQLSERKAFWLDYQMRKHTVNPVAISQNLSSRFSKYVEVLYNKSLTIQEQESSFDEQNNEQVTISLPINRIISYNSLVDTRYDDQDLLTRTDAVLNTNTTDLQDLLSYHKAGVNNNIWLIIRANQTRTTGGAGEDIVAANGSPPYVPSFDISFQTNYKIIDSQF